MKSVLAAIGVGRQRDREGLQGMSGTPDGKSAYDLVMEATPALSIPPADCTNACSGGECDCSGEYRVRAWSVDIPTLRMLLAPDARTCSSRRVVSPYFKRHKRGR